MDRLFYSLNETLETISDSLTGLKVPDWSILRGGLVSLVRDRLKTQRRPKRDGLPLLLQSSWHPSITRDQAAEVEKVMEALRDLSVDLLALLHQVCSHLKFWRERNEVHMEVDKLGAELTKGDNSRSATSASILAVFRAMVALEGLYDLPQTDSSNSDDTRATSSISLQFDEMPQELLRKTDWTDEDVGKGIEMLSTNVEMLRFMVDCLMIHHQKPTKLTRKWIRYTATTAVIALASAWVIRHSRLMGSDDLDRWLGEGKAAVVSFTKEHVEQPLVAIRDELFETFRKRHNNEVDVVVEAQLTADSLQRMLLDYVKQTSGNVSEDITQEEMMRLMMTRYEDEVVHPMRNLVMGQLARALLIQVQKLKLDTERAMVELNQILRANEINFAILAAFPAVLLTVVLGYIIQDLLNKEGKRVGRGRDAQAARRMLMAEVEKAILTFQMMLDEEREEEAAWRFGMVIYALDKLYRSVEHGARSSHEWTSLRGDIMDLATPRLATSYKLAITARMERIYECLVPLPNYK